MLPTTTEEILSFLRLAGNLSAWIPRFALLACLLYKVVKSPLPGALDPSKSVMLAFSGFQDRLLQNSALAPPDIDQLLSRELLTNGE